jgi:hypothetical protein
MNTSSSMRVKYCSFGLSKRVKQSQFVKLRSKNHLQKQDTTTYWIFRLRKLKKETYGVLDRCTIQTAWGKCTPRQQMSGISGKAILGISQLTPLPTNQVLRFSAAGQ